jgi:chaperonin GroES
MAIRVRPIHDRIVVRRDAPETEWEGSSIAIPESHQRPKRQGEVLAVGPGHISSKGTLMPTGLKPGDRVYFGSYAGVEIEVDGEKYQIMRANDVAGVIEGE